MPRPPFEPEPDQQRLLDVLHRLALRRAADDEKLTTFILAADKAGVPIQVIAEVADVDRHTVYRRLGRPAR